MKLSMHVREGRSASLISMVLETSTWHVAHTISCIMSEPEEVEAIQMERKEQGRSSDSHTSKASFAVAVEIQIKLGNAPTCWLI